MQQQRPLDADGDVVMRPAAATAAAASALAPSKHVHLETKTSMTTTNDLQVAAINLGDATRSLESRGDLGSDRAADDNKKQQQEPLSFFPTGFYFDNEAKRMQIFGRTPILDAKTCRTESIRVDIDFKLHFYLLLPEEFQSQWTDRLRDYLETIPDVGKHMRRVSKWEYTENIGYRVFRFEKPYKLIKITVPDMFVHSQVRRALMDVGTICLPESIPVQQPQPKREKKWSTRGRGGARGGGRGGGRSGRDEDSKEQGKRDSERELRSLATSMVRPRKRGWLDQDPEEQDDPEAIAAMMDMLAQQSGDRDDDAGAEEKGAAKGGKESKESKESDKVWGHSSSSLSASLTSGPTSSFSTLYPADAADESIGNGNSGVVLCRIPVCFFEHRVQPVPRFFAQHLHPSCPMRMFNYVNARTSKNDATKQQALREPTLVDEHYASKRKFIKVVDPNDPLMLSQIPFKTLAFDIETTTLKTDVPEAEVLTIQCMRHDAATDRTVLVVYTWRSPFSTDRDGQKVFGQDSPEDQIADIKTRRKGVQYIRYGPVIVVICRNSRSMLDVWHKEEILAQNPDILCGHNSSRFDMDYMILQAAKMGKSLEEFMLWGRNHCPSELRRLGSKWSSTMWESIGRFHIDTCTFAAVYGKKQDKYDLRTTAGLLLKSLSKTENPKSRDYLDPAKTTRFQSMLRDFLVSSPPAAAGTASASAIASDDELKCGLLQTQQPFKFKHIDMLNKDKGDIDPLEIATMFHSPDVNERMKLFDYGLKDVIITLRLCIEQDMPMRSTVLARKFRATTDVMLNSGQNEKLAVALLGEMHTKGIVINDYSVPSMDPLEKATESFSYLGGFVQVPQRDMVKFKPTASKHVRQLHASSVAIQAEAKRAFEAKIAAAVLIEEEAKAKQQQQQQQQSHADSKRKFPDVATGELPASGSKETKSSRDEEAKSSASAPPLDSMDELLLHGGNAQRASRPSLGGLSAVTAYRLRSFDDVLAAQQRLRELARQTGSKECRGNALSDLQPGEIPPPPPLPEELIAPLPPSYMLDFISMYPSMMIGHHLDPQTLLETKFITPAQWAILRDKENCPWKWKIETVQGLRSNCITCLNMSSVLCACLFPWQVENTDGSKRETLIILGRWATEPVLDATTGEPIPGKRRFKMATTRVVEDKKTKTKTTISIEPERILEPMGICPQLQRKMKNLRAEVKGAIKKEKDPFKLAMMDLEQNAIKLFMNAMYGIFALENGQFAYCLLAAMITQLGRDTIQKCRDRAVELGKEQGVVPIYGDTDSAAFRMMMDAVIIAANVQFAQDILDRVPRDKALRKWSLAVIRRTFEFARKQADQISSEQFSDDLQFEVDKMLLPMRIGSAKKKYGGMEWTMDAETKKIEEWTYPVMKVTGVESKKSDRCLDLRDLLEQLMKLVFHLEPDLDAICKLTEERLTMVATQVVPLERMVIIKKLTKDAQEYNESSPPEHVSVVRRKEARGDFEDSTQGSRITLLHVFPPRTVEERRARRNALGRGMLKRKPLTGKVKMSIAEDFKYSVKHKLQLDWNHYLTNHYRKPIQGVFDFLGENREVSSRLDGIFHRVSELAARKTNDFGLADKRTISKTETALRVTGAAIKVEDHNQAQAAAAPSTASASASAASSLALVRTIARDKVIRIDKSNSVYTSSVGLPAGSVRPGRYLAPLLKPKSKPIGQERLDRAVSVVPLPLTTAVASSGALNSSLVGMPRKRKAPDTCDDHHQEDGDDDPEREQGPEIKRYKISATARGMSLG